MAPLTFARDRTAVLCLDLQAGIVSIYTKDDQEPFLSRAGLVLEWARANQLLIIHVRVGFRPGLPEISNVNPLFGAIKQSPDHQRLFEGPIGDFHPAIAPRPHEIVVVKHRVSAFCGTDLDMILRARGTHTLILLGIATSGVVLSTALEASDADYQLVVVGDCCADLEPTLHASLLEQLFPRRGTVVASTDLTQAIFD